MARYLLDTDAVIDVYKGFPATIELMENLYRQGDTPCTCDVVITEVFAGLYPFERETGRQLLDSMQFLLTSPSASRQAGIWRFEFARRGKQLPTTDCLIAATALDRQATVITGNLADYPMSEISILPLPRRR